MANTPVINSFNAGELSPYLYARNDLKKYNSGCLTLENFQALPYGGAVRRPAIKHVVQTKNDENVRLIEFEFSSEQTYILEFGDEYVRFIKDGAQLDGSYSAWAGTINYIIGDTVNVDGVDYIALTNHTPTVFADDLADADWTTVGAPVNTNVWAGPPPYVNGDMVSESGSYYRCIADHGASVLFATDSASWEISTGATDLAYELATPYLIAEVHDIRVVQSADVMWICNTNHPVQRLSRFADTTWTIAEETYTFPVFREQNIGSTTLTYTGDEEAGTIGGALAASADLFDANHVGSYWQIKHIRPNTSISAKLLTTNVAPVVPVPNALTVANSTIAGAGINISFTTYGIATGKHIIWRSFDSGVSWEQYRYYEMSGRNVSTSWTTENEEAIYAIGGDSGGTFELTVNEAFDTGVVQITTVTDARNAVVDVIRSLGSATTTVPTLKWSEGAWSAFRGYPQAIALWESRLIFAGTVSDPNTIWLSTIDDFNNFDQSTLDDAAMTVTIGSGRLDEIRWMVPQHSLIIGTSGSEWALEAESDNKPVTPSSFSLKRKTTYGSSSAVQGVLVNSAVLFVMRQGRKVREFVYQFESQDYVAPDLTVLAEHITEGGITGAAYQQQPDNNLLAIRSDGTMIPMTYERDQDVTGWQRWNSDHFTFESVAVLPRDNDEDAVYVSCKMTGSNERYIGIMDNREWGTDVATEWAGADFYVVTDITDIGEATISGLDRFNGYPVDITRDGMVEPQQTVSGGTIELQTPFSPPITVSGTSTDADGVYEQGLDTNGKVSYTKSGYWIYWDGATDWLITETAGSTTLHSVTDSDTNPPETGWSGGAVLSYTTSSRIVVGLPYTSTMAPMYIQPNSQFVQPMGKHKGVFKAVIRFKDTIHAKVGQTVDKLQTVSFRSTTDALDTQVDLFSGEKKVNFDNRYELLHTCHVVQDKPLPMTVVAMVPWLEVHE